MAKFKITGTAWGYYIEQNGKTVRGPYDSKAFTKSLAVTLKEEHDAKMRTKIRAGFTYKVCICCETVFPSEGIHHRMCTPCRTNPTKAIERAA